MAEIERVYSLIEASKLLGYAVRTLRMWCVTGKIDARKIGDYNDKLHGKWVIPESEIMRLRGIGDENSGD